MKKIIVTLCLITSVSIFSACTNNTAKSNTKESAEEIKIQTKEEILKKIPKWEDISDAYYEYEELSEDEDSQEQIEEKEKFDDFSDYLKYKGYSNKEIDAALQGYSINETEMTNNDIDLMCRQYQYTIEEEGLFGIPYRKITQRYFESEPEINDSGISFTSENYIIKPYTSKFEKIGDAYVGCPVLQPYKAEKGDKYNDGFMFTVLIYYDENKKMKDIKDLDLEMKFKKYVAKPSTEFSKENDNILNCFGNYPNTEVFGKGDASKYKGKNTYKEYLNETLLEGGVLA